MMYVAYFFAGAFLCNCVPHLVAGLQGKPFPTPFASPPGEGDSPPTVNVAWAFANLVGGLYLTTLGSLTFGPNLPFGTVLVGALLTAYFTATHFGRVERAKHSHV